MEGKRVDVRQQPLRVGINPWPGYEFAFLAERLGYFKQLGVDVRLVEFQSLGDSQLAFERGQIDGLFCSMQELIEIEQRQRRCPVPVWVCDSSRGGDILLSQSHLQHLSDLRGKRIAYEPRTVNEYVLYRALETAQLTVADVELVPTSQSRMKTLLAEGHVDAVVTYPPFSLECSDEQAVKTLFSTRQIPDEVIDFIAFDQQRLKERPREIAAFCEAFARAVEHYRTNPQSDLVILAGRLAISHQEFERVLQEDLVIYEPANQAELLSDPFLETLRERHRKAHSFLERISPASADDSGSPAS